MKLSDIVGNAGLTIYPIIAMIAFVIACIGIGIYVLARRNQPLFARASRMPLEEAPTVAATRAAREPRRLRGNSELQGSELQGSELQGSELQGSELQGNGGTR